MGGLFGAVAPVAEIQNVPFAFRSHEHVFSVMDGALGDHLREELAAKGIYSRGGRETRPLKVTIEKIDFVYQGTPHSLRFHWLLNAGGDARRTCGTSTARGKVSFTSRATSSYRPARVNVKPKAARCRPCPSMICPSPLTLRSACKGIPSAPVT